VSFDIAYKMLLPALQFFAQQTHSYGWAIILLTLAVRIVVWPLVSQSTRSMQRMSKLQPQLKLMQERYKSDPEALQRKMAEFYKNNKINPFGGCLPMLIQLPILFALFATFSGPPFGDRYIDVKVNVVPKVDSATEKPKETSSGNSAYISKDGKAAKVVVFPGDSTVAVGDSLVFGTRAIEGELPPDFTHPWKVVGPTSKNMQGPSAEKTDATIDEQGRAIFSKVGEYHVGACIPGVAKDEKFLFIDGLGKIANGLKLLLPANWDALGLILAFGGTMYLSQKFTISTPKPAPGDKLDEQQIIQQQTAKSMPIVATAMFLFVPLPTGVYLYLVLSNVIQTFQTWLLQANVDLVQSLLSARLVKNPEPDFVGLAPESKEDTKNGKRDADGNTSNENGSEKRKSDTANSGSAANKKKKQKRKKN
jgi:YidC/Oxa1 family membrane protein insertase